MINFIKLSKYFITLSLILIGFSVYLIFGKGLNYGIDFSGGNLLQFSYSNNVTLADINQKLNILTDIPQIGANSRKVQVSEDKTVIIRIQEVSDDAKNKIIETMKTLGECSIDRDEKVGASVGKELKNAAILALVVGAILIGIYITIRFEVMFAVGSILALIHDVILSVGGIALLGYEINSPFIAAVLTILGYSINDTIVLYDRIRENLKNRKRAKLSYEETFNLSMNQVIKRAINTSLTTMFAVVAVLIFGGDSLKTFITTLLFGMIFGTLSSMFLAGPLVYYLSGKGKRLDKFDKEKKEEVEDKILV